NGEEIFEKLVERLAMKDGGRRDLIDKVRVESQGALRELDKWDTPGDHGGYDRVLVYLRAHFTYFME
ncbi:MAG: hypothetical protein Q9211_006893, partial [Gyalolechia sp. 1 TL-2023]